MHSVNTDASCIFYYSRFVGFSEDFLENKKKNAPHEYPGLVGVLQMCYMDGLSTQYRMFPGQAEIPGKCVTAQTHIAIIPTQRNKGWLRKPGEMLTSPIYLPFFFHTLRFYGEPRHLFWRIFGWGKEFDVTGHCSRKALGIKSPIWTHVWLPFSWPISF